MAADLRAAVLRQADAQRERCERELDDAGMPLPLPQRAAWASAVGARSWLVALRDVHGRCRYASGVQVHASRALPGHRVLRLERLNPARCPDAARHAVATLTETARRAGRVLRVHVELFCPDPAARRQAADWLAGLGYRRALQSRVYTQTLLLDLAREEAQIFAGLSGRAQRNIKVIDKHQVALRPLLEPGVAPQLDALARAAFGRTGGAYRGYPWSRVIELSARHPELSRLVGLFRTDVEGPASLLGFAWGQFHGDHAHYAMGASARPADLRIPLSYALVWDLARWARRVGASCMDLGGVSDALAGISDFKRAFSEQVVDVGEEWVLEPHRARAGLARVVSGGAAWLAGLRERAAPLIAARGARGAAAAG